MRHRVEDLGRIAVLIKNIIELDVFTKYQMKPKYFCDWFYELTNEEKEQIIYEFACGREKVSELLHEILWISLGKDDLNDTEIDI